jgi:hypothetical protein
MTAVEVKPVTSRYFFLATQSKINLVRLLRGRAQANFKTVVFVVLNDEWHQQACSRLELKSQASFCPRSLSLSMGTYN